MYGKISQKTYLPLHFSTDFNKKGLKWKKKSISKISPAGFLTFYLVFPKLDFELSKMMPWNNLCWKFPKKLNSPSFLNRFQQTISQMKEECSSRIIKFRFRFSEIGLWNFKIDVLKKIMLKISQKTYLLLHFSTDLDKQGLKWKNKSISKISRAGFLNFDFVFLKLDFEISKLRSWKNLLKFHKKPISSFISQPISTNKVLNERLSQYL